jgi:creatinine amidohydrolase
MTEFGALAYPDAAALLAEERRTVLLLPLGATEPHGPHAPLETDTLISLSLCVRAAPTLEDDADVRALVHPPLPHGVTRYGAAFPDGIYDRQATLRALVREIAGSRSAQGFPRMVLVSSRCHAGRYETSLVLAERPELVHRERMEALESKMIDTPAAIAAGQRHFPVMGMDRAYCGAPAGATAEEGERTFEILTELHVSLVCEVAVC